MHNGGYIVNCNLFILQFSHIRTCSDTLPMLSGFLTFLDVIVIGLCCISLFLTFNSLRRALKLARVGKFANAVEIFLRN